MLDFLTSELVYTGMFWFLSVVTIGAGFVVAFSRDLARAIFMLLFALGGIAGFYGWLGADFLFAAQMLIYVGGILVILIFAMMVSQRFPVEEEEPNLNKDMAGLLISLVIFASIAGVAFGGNWPEVSLSEFEPTTQALGEALLTTYLLPFEIAGLILLIALLAATLLTRVEEDEPAEANS